MTRHELFRRILCDTLGRDVDAGLIPADPELLSAIVRGVCLDNAVALVRPVTPDRIVVMGVTGSGKSTLGAALADRLGVPLPRGGRLPRPQQRREDGRRRAARRRRPLAVARRASAGDARRGAGGGRLLGAQAPLPRRAAARPATSASSISSPTAGEIDGRLAGAPATSWPPGMVESQFETLEPPGADETDVATIPAGGDPSSLLAAAEEALATLRPGTAAAPSARRRRQRPVDRARRAGDHRRADRRDRDPGRRRATGPARPARPHPAPLQGRRDRRRPLRDAVRGRMRRRRPAGDRHARCDDARRDRPALRRARSRSSGCSRTGWRDGLARLGEIAADEVAAALVRPAADGDPGRGRRAAARRLGSRRLDRPGRAARGGRHGELHQEPRHRPRRRARRSTAATSSAPSATWRRSWAGPTPGPRRRRRGLRPLPGRPRSSVLWLLTVMEDTPAGVVQRGLFAGRGGSGESGGAAYRAAAELSARCNIDGRPGAARAGRLLARPGGVPDDLARQQGRLPHADGDRRRRRAGRARARRRPLRRGPGDRRAHPPPRLPRHAGHARGASRPIPSWPANLGAAAHLIHGSSEGRFRITYCTDPATAASPLARSRGSATAGARWPRSSPVWAWTARRPPAREWTAEAGSSGTWPTRPSVFGWLPRVNAEVPTRKSQWARDCPKPAEEMPSGTHPGGRLG